MSFTRKCSAIKYISYWPNLFGQDNVSEYCPHFCFGYLLSSTLSRSVNRQMTLPAFATIMDKSSWDTPPKKPVWLNESVFQSQIFNFRPLLHFLLQPRTCNSVHGAYFNFEKGEREGWWSTNKCVLQLRMDADRKRLFCSNVSTFLSMIVAMLTKQTWWKI